MRPYKKRAPTPKYVSPNQRCFEGFETPFEQKLDEINLWQILIQKILWDTIVGVYDRLFSSSEGRAMLTKYITVAKIEKNLKTEVSNSLQNP